MSEYCACVLYKVIQIIRSFFLPKRESRLRRYDTQIQTHLTVLLIPIQDLLINRLIQTNPLHRTNNLMGPRSIRPADRVLPIGIDYQSDQVRPHIMTAKVIQCLAQMTLVEIDVHKYQALEVLGGLLNEGLAIWSVDPRVAVVNVVIFCVFARWSLQGDSGGRNGLEGREGVGCRFDGVGGRYNVRVGVGDVGVRIWVLEGCGARIERPGRSTLVTPRVMLVISCRAYHAAT